MIGLEEGGELRGKRGSEVRRQRRKLESDPGVTFRLSEPGPQAQRDLESLLELHAHRWGPDHFDPAALAFQRAFARRAGERDWLRLWVMEAGDRVVAASYGWRLGDVEFGYLQAHDPAFSRQSPGMVITAHVVEQAASDGCREFNMLRGGESYKGAWGAQERALQSAFLVRRRSLASLGTHVTVQTHRAWRRLPKRQRDRLRRLRG